MEEESFKEIEINVPLLFFLRSNSCFNDYYNSRDIVYKYWCRRDLTFVDSLVIAGVPENALMPALPLLVISDKALAVE